MVGRHFRGSLAARLAAQLAAGRWGCCKAQPNLQMHAPNTHPRAFTNLHAPLFPFFKTRRMTIFEDHLVRDINAGRFADNSSLVLVTHGLALRVFLMR